MNDKEVHMRNIGNANNEFEDRTHKEDPQTSKIPSKNPSGVATRSQKQKGADNTDPTQ